MVFDHVRRGKGTDHVLTQEAVEAGLQKRIFRPAKSKIGLGANHMMV